MLRLAPGLSFFVLANLLCAQTITNPVFNAPDPWIAHEDGYYYFSVACLARSICVKRSATLEGLGKAPNMEVWKAPATGPNNSEIWAPEIHKVKGKWYIYYAADPNHDNNFHRLFVIEAMSEDPLGYYQMGTTGAPNGQIVESLATWGIDPDVFTAADGKLYLTWSCADLKDPRHPQDLCLARLRDPLHLSSDSVRIARAVEPWETRSGPILEGPVGYSRDGRTFITYSASASWTTDYSVGLLTSNGQNLLDASNWVKSGPIFDNHDTAYGPGSVVFVEAPNGQWWNVYHGIDRLDCHPAYICRDVRMQPMTWAKDGAPELGYPIDPGVTIPAPSSSEKIFNSPWGPAYGDRAEGNTRSGSVSGDWINRDPTANENSTLGAVWAQTFLQSNPNLETYTLNVDVQLVEEGETSPAPRYGVYAAYSDARDFVSVWIDLEAKTVSTYGVLAGQIAPFAACALADSFDAKQFHSLSVSKAADRFSVSLDGTALAGDCNTRRFGLLNGQVGLVTEDAHVRYRNISVRP